ncbi:cytochrome c oxidase subunit II [Virgibacillus ndiopensis]|uniref:cytochrome c oxidase subunit II n=1 Tax=Virgibacillus ndiopensis TaxID=2004408 RepID=UPI000C08A12B|nr:cytochrome c oxidase subunit II [Virgibacillus ndiopensis]
MKNILIRIRLLVFACLLTGCDISVLDPQSKTADNQAFLISFSFALMMIVLIIVFLLMTRFVWKYRETEHNKNTIPKDIKGNKKLELTWTILPILLLTVLAVPTIAVTYNQSATTPKATTQDDAIHIDVTAQQFFWTFTYGNGKESTNELVIPENKSIVFHLKSTDVIHSFWIPSLGGKTDVLPEKELVYKIDNPKKGTYDGKCAEFCGVNHTKMRFTARVVSEETYQKWLTK